MLLFLSSTQTKSYCFDKVSRHSVFDALCVLKWPECDLTAFGKCLSVYVCICEKKILRQA